MICEKDSIQNVTVVFHNLGSQRTYHAPGGLHSSASISAPICACASLPLNAMRDWLKRVDSGAVLLGTAPSGGVHVSSPLSATAIEPPILTVFLNVNI